MKKLFAVSCSLFALATAFAAVEPRNYYGNAAKRLGDSLPKYHVLQQPMDDEISRRAWTNLVTFYDYDHSVFLKSDLDRLARHELTIDDEIGKDVDPDYNPQIDVGTVERCRERLTAAVQMYQRAKGDLPAGLAGLVEAILKPEIDWKELLAQFVTSAYGGSRRWLPPNRRHVGRGLYLQSSRKETLRAVVAVDTSGSTTAYLPQFFSELNGLLNSFGGYELTVIQCDAEIQDVQKYDANAPYEGQDWQSYGHGGTSFIPPFDYVRDHPELEPSCFIYITDGFGPAPDRAPPYPVLWLVTPDGEYPAEWGRRLKLKGGD